MKVICDTNSITALRLGNQQVLTSLEQATTVYLSVIVMGELLYGFAKGRKEKENLNVLQAFLEKPTVQLLPVNDETARVYAQLRIDLTRRGKPIPTNDLWIASQAIEHGALLLTNDLHFNSLTGLRRQPF